MTIDVVVKRYASVSGTVSATDELTGDVPVAIFRADGDGAEVGSTRTDRGGRFTLRDIVPGTY